MSVCKRTLHTILAVSGLLVFATSVSAMGMGGGGTMGGMGVGVAGAATSAAIGAAAAASASSYSSGGGTAKGVPVGATDGPSGMSATSGRNPFGHVGASSAWSSLPPLDPDLPGIAVPSAR